MNMQKFFFSAVAALSVGSSAHALHYFNCADAGTTVTIVEHEIFGANPTGCYYKGSAVEDGKVVLDKKSKQLVIPRKVTGTARDWEDNFTVKATLSSAKGLPEPKIRGESRTTTPKVETLLICKEVSTSALDLVGPGKLNCEVTWQ